MHGIWNGMQCNGHQGICGFKVQLFPDVCHNMRKWLVCLQVMQLAHAIKLLTFCEPRLKAVLRVLTVCFLQSCEW